jgi:lipopolysaccharide export system permease protein
VIDALESKRKLSPTLYRYILGEMFFSFFICFLFFFFVFFVNQILLLAREVLERRVPFIQVSLLIIYSMPSIIAMSAPFASLVGTLMTVGRLSSDNEILVMLSSGFSYKIVFFPAITMGVVITLVSFFTNDVLIPAGTIQYNRLLRRILVTVPALELEANTVKRFRDTIIVSGGVTGNTVNNLVILDRTNDGERRIILANAAELRDGGREGLSFHMTDTFIHSSREIARDDYDYAYARFLQYWVSNEDIIQSVMSVSPREMSSRDVYSSIIQRRADMVEREKERRIRLTHQALTLENILRAGPDSIQWNRRASNVTNFHREIAALRSIQNDRSIIIHLTELHRKFTFPFGAFCFIFLAVSLGFMAKKSGQTVGFIFGILISVLYWCMVFVGQTMSLRMMTSPFWSMWLANILSLAIGIVLAVIRMRK